MYAIIISPQDINISFSQISSQVTLWDWARDVVIPGLYVDSKDVAVSNSTPYISDGDAVLVGMPRLRQLRVMKGKQRVLMTRESIYSIYIYIYLS